MYKRGERMKKILLLTISIFLLLILTGCTNKDAINFKNDYESLNGKENKNGKIHRTITISKKNPFVTVEPKDIVQKIEDKETFYVYFGSKLCPWCRSVIEKATEVANDYEIKTIYYVDVWDDEGNEILRDEYSLDDNGKPKLEKEGTEEYKKLLKTFDELLRDYTITNDDGDKIEVGEKRIYAPNFIFVNKGKASKLITGKSDKQKDSREELTKEILADEQAAFEDFFAETCDESC